MKYDKLFYFKEVGIYNRWRENISLYHIRLPSTILLAKTIEIKFCSKYVHCLPLRNHVGDITYRKFIDNLQKYFDPNRQYLWANKGGNVEKELLSSLGYKYVNLEDWMSQGGKYNK